MKRKLLFIFGVLCLIFVIGELALRYYGFAHAVLYIASDKYEYIAAPNQDGTRFGNHYHINSYSQRCEEPDSSKTIILGLGDSVLFGGAMCAQEDLATELFSQETSMQMLNISGGSWGPDNCAAYLREKGLFGASAIFLLVSSHDAYDNMDFYPVVGHHLNYPSKQYTLAWGDLLKRYILPRYFNVGNNDLDPDQKVVNGIRKNGKEFNPGFNQLKAIADSANIPLIVYLHADETELNVGKYNEQGDDIMVWADSCNLKLYRDLDLGISKEDYRDIIHLSKIGQRHLADNMKKIFQYPLQ
jgi:hypothetical protein